MNDIALQCIGATIGLIIGIFLSVGILYFRKLREYNKNHKRWSEFREERLINDHKPA